MNSEKRATVDLIEQNISILKNRRILKKYKYLNLLFQKDLRRFYFQIMDFIKGKNLFSYWKKESFYIETDKLVSLRKKMGKGTANRHINFLCAMGLIGKHPLYRHNVSPIHKNFLKNKRPRPKNLQPLNQYFIFPYDAECLMTIENNCKLLVKNKITKGNISKDTLLIAGLAEMAKKIYGSVNSSMYWKNESYVRISQFIEEAIQEKGYTTKEEIYKNVILNKVSNITAVDKIFKQLKKQFELDYVYKRPSKTEKIRFHLVSDKWIIVPRIDL